jgi:hypothetical protein
VLAAMSAESVPLYVPLGFVAFGLMFWFTGSRPRFALLPLAVAWVAFVIGLFVLAGRA